MLVCNKQESDEKYYNNNEKLVLHHTILMQTQQRTPLRYRETRNETNVSSLFSILLKLNKEIIISPSFRQRITLLWCSRSLINVSFCSQTDKFTTNNNTVGGDVVRTCVCASACMEAGAHAHPVGRHPVYDVIR